MLINRSHLARIGHHYPPAKCFQKSTDPRTMRSRLHHPERTVITTGQLPQRDSIVADAVLLDYFSPLIQRTKPVPAISQIQSYRNVTALGLLLHRRRAYLSAIAHTLFAFSSNLVRYFGYWISPSKRKIYSSLSSPLPWAKSLFSSIISKSHFCNTLIDLMLSSQLLRKVA